MLARSYTAGILGVEGYHVTCEAEVGPGLPCLTVIGQARGALSESRDRVKAAMGHCGHRVETRKQVVNLAPAERRKDSSGTDLAIALALLAAHEVIPAEALHGVTCWGELGLDGALRPAPGTLVVADCARREGQHRLLVPAASAAEASLVGQVEVVPLDNLAQAVAVLRGDRPAPRAPAVGDGVSPLEGPDLADVRGLAAARKALEVLAAGGHHLLLHGSPGVGKTMLARRAAGLLPDLDRDAAFEVTKIRSVARGQLPGDLDRRPPFRAPHHTVSAAGLLGGGTPPRPGEVTLAHRGILFLDELPEFPRAAIEGLREPLEEGEVRIVRARHAVQLPARFQLIAAMNPCPCGFLGHPQRTCVDSASAVQRYQGRVSGPFMDRMDLVIPVHPPPRGGVGDLPIGESTARVRHRIEGARRRQALRLRRTRLRSNAEIPAESGSMQSLCAMTNSAAALLRALTETRMMSARAQHRLRRVARTLSDLRASEVDPFAPIEEEDVAAAAALRELPES